LQILAAFTNQSIEQTVSDCQSLDTLGLKERTADVINAHFEPIRQEYSRIIEDPSFVVDTLAKGREKAQEIAHETMQTLKERLGFYTGK
jgi:tryptophanyl-tRNA synthetase